MEEYLSEYVNRKTERDVESYEVVMSKKLVRILQKIRKQAY